MGCSPSSHIGDEDKEANTEDNAEDFVENEDVSVIESGRPLKTDKKVHDKQGNRDNSATTLPGTIPILDSNNPLDNLPDNKRKLPPIQHPVGKIY
jgi:hypothetical protein